MHTSTANHHSLHIGRRFTVLCCIISLVILPLQPVMAYQTSMEYYHHNHQGSLLEVYDGATNKRLLSQAWSPWGERQILHSAASGNGNNERSLLSRGLPAHMGYTGHKRLLATGLDFAGDTRLYDARLKRFLNSDDRTTGGVRGQNRYSYAYNNPMTYIDPDGRSPISMLGQFFRRPTSTPMVQGIEIIGNAVGTVTTTVAGQVLAGNVMGTVNGASSSASADANVDAPVQGVVVTPEMMEAAIPVIGRPVTRSWRTDVRDVARRAHTAVLSLAVAASLYANVEGINTGSPHLASLACPIFAAATHNLVVSSLLPSQNIINILACGASNLLASSSFPISNHLYYDARGGSIETYTSPRTANLRGALIAAAAFSLFSGAAQVVANNFSNVSNDARKAVRSFSVVTMGFSATTLSSLALFLLHHPTGQDTLKDFHPVYAVQAATTVPMYTAMALRNANFHSIRAGFWTGAAALSTALLTIGVYDLVLSLGHQ